MWVWQAREFDLEIETVAKTVLLFWHEREFNSGRKRQWKLQQARLLKTPMPKVR
jgi:hypothetical protein